MKLEFDRLRIFGLIIVMFSSCELSDELTVRDINLKFDIGTLRINYPLELDTIYNWIDRGDCNCCDRNKIRISKSELMTIESGFMGKSRIPGRLNQITIIQRNYLNCEAEYNLDSILKKRVGDYNGKYQDHSKHWKRKRIQKIDNSTFIVLGLNIYEELSNELLDSIVELITYKNGEKVTIEYICRRDSCEKFVKEMLRQVELIKLD